MELFNLDYETLKLIIATFGLVAVVVGTFAAVRSLRQVRASHQMQALDRFMTYLENTSEERRFVFDNVDYGKNEYLIDDKSEQKMQAAVNCLNRIGILLDQKFADEKMLLGIVHTVIIRLVYILKPYLDYREAQIGGRYGRRLLTLDMKAKRYHDCWEKHRVTEIKISQLTEKTIYKTQILPGIKGFLQRIGWWLSRITNHY